MKPKTMDAAKGMWASILPQLGIDANVLDGNHHACPATGEGKDRFRFDRNSDDGRFFCACSNGSRNGMELLMCCKGLTFAKAAAEVDKVLPTSVETKAVPKPDAKPLLKRIQSAAKPAGDCVKDYLHSRGITVESRAIRQVRWKYWHEGKSLGEFECMAAILQSPDNKGVTYHLTYLDNGRKADVPTVRKMMPVARSMAGSAIRLFPSAEVMGVAEGIETALSATQLFGIPTWATANAGNLERFEPPNVCRKLVIFADNDDSFAGQKSAYVLANKLRIKGMVVEVRIPASGDWNDEVLK